MNKVAVIKCESYEVEKVYESLKRGIDLIGGIERFVSKEENILIKPNLLRAKEVEYAVTTHPSVFEALIMILKENGYNNLSYGDSPGLGSTSHVAKKVGLSSVASKYDVIEKDFSKGEVLSNPKCQFTKQFNIATPVIECDSLINVGKMKAHALTRITGATKNLLGCVNGVNKSLFHAKYPDALSFTKMLVDLAICVNPKLNIIDGIIAMEGEGPASGEPINMNVLIISESPISADAVFAKLVDLDKDYLPMFEYSEQTEYGSYKDEDIEIVGDDITPLINPKFDVVRKPLGDDNQSRLGKLRYFKSFILKKPYVIKGNCIKCKICYEACPLEDKAITMETKDGMPKYDYNKCIRCYCCQEMCPNKAIKVKTPLLNRILSK